MKKILLGVGIVALFTGPVVQANPYLSLGCSGCHGAAGQGGTGPALAGKEAAWTVKQLKDFQSGARVSPTMNAMAGMAKDKEQEIADFLASK